MTRQRVTSRQVAQRAGVSQTTVSFVLNNVESANISQATIQRVLQAAEELGYVPDSAARNLARGRSMNIGFVLARPHAQVYIDEYVPNILTGINRVTQQHGFRILVEHVNQNPASTYLNLARGKEVAGLIVSPGQMTAEDVEALTDIVQEGFPVVSLSSINNIIPSIDKNQFQGVQLAVNHILAKGHERIACITYAPIDTNLVAKQRLEIFQSVLEHHGRTYFPELVRYGSYDPQSGYEMMQNILETNHIPPTALFAMNDMMAFGAIRAIHDQGLRVPEDIAIVGFDNVRLAGFSTPPLTTIDGRDVDHGFLAAALLIDLINDVEVEDRHIVLDLDLIVRESCGSLSQTNDKL